jgi:hypothetical protein
MTDPKDGRITDAGGAGSAGSTPGRGDRRGNERRRDDRRAPTPLWRKPWAFAGYGVIAALIVVLLLGGEEEAPQLADAGAPLDSVRGQTYTIPDTPPGTIRDAYSVAEFEALIAEGEQAVGDVVRTEIFCGSISPLAVREHERMNPAVNALADAEGRVAGAECRWSREARTADFILIVPPVLAEAFAQAPEEELNFVRLRRVSANVEWLGRSEELALRYSGILREIIPS